MVSARRVAAALLAAAFHAAPADAQAPAPRRYRLMLGASLNGFDPFDVDTGTHLAPGIMVRGVPRAGWGPVVDFSVVKLDLKNGSQGRPLGELRVAAPLAGYGYTLERGQFAFTIHAAAGWGFNRVETDQPPAEGALFEVKDGPIFRSGITLTRFLGSRFALTTSFGGIRMEPDVALALQAGQGQPRTETGTWTTSGLYWGVGAAYKVF